MIDRTPKFVLGSRFGGSGISQIDETPSAFSKPPTLKQKLVLIPGGGRSAVDFQPLIDDLCKDSQNRATSPWDPKKMRFKKGYHDEEILRFEWISRIGSAKQNADELAGFLSMLNTREFTVVTTCKGGPDFREYLYRYGNGRFHFEKIICVAPPNHGFWGAGEAIAAARLFKKFGLPIRAAGGYHLNSENWDGLASIKTDVHFLGRWFANNPYLHRLNTRENFKAESQKVGKITVVAGTGLPLFAGRTNWPLLKNGLFFLPAASDSVVPVWSAWVPNAHTTVIKLPSPQRNVQSEHTMDPHKSFIFNEVTLAKINNELTGNPIPENLKQWIVEETPPSLDEGGPISRVPALGAIAGCLSGMLLGGALSLGAIPYIPLALAGKKSKVFLGIVKYGPCF